MKISREEKKALKLQAKQEKLERKELLRQEKMQKKMKKNSHFEEEEPTQPELDSVLLTSDNQEHAENLNQESNLNIEEIQEESNLENIQSDEDEKSFEEETTNLESTEQVLDDEAIEETNNLDIASEEQNISDAVVEDVNNKECDESIQNVNDDDSQKQEDINASIVKEDESSDRVDENLVCNSITEEAESEEKLVEVEEDQSEKAEEKNTKKEKVSFFKKIKNALKKTKDSISNKIDQIFGKGELNDEFFEDMEDILISSDLGVETSSDIIENMRAKIKKDKLKTAEEVKDALRETIAEMLDFEKEEEVFPKVNIIVGVNGVGKTTTIGKLANYYKSLGKKVVVVAGDTFRAAASDQLTEWAKRADVKIIKQSEGADSASVVFDGISFAKAKGFDVVLVDTAGRLHNKVNLMEELSKVNRVATKNWPEAHFERFIVIDSTTGQNAVNQVREFNEAVELDGIVLTKLDGSAKGGIVVSISNEFDIPVKFVGVGEGMDDLVPFDAHEFVEGII